MLLNYLRRSVTSPDEDRRKSSKRSQRAIDIKIYSILMPQLINDDAQRNETRRDRGSRQTTLFCGYRFAKCFIVDCAFRCKTKESCASRYKLHRTECAELKFLRTRNTKHNSDLRTQSVVHNLLHLVQKISFSSSLLGCARKEIFVVQRGITNELTAGS